MIDAEARATYAILLLARGLVMDPIRRCAAQTQHGGTLGARNCNVYNLPFRGEIGSHHGGENGCPRGIQDGVATPEQHIMWSAIFPKPSRVLVRAAVHRSF